MRFRRREQQKDMRLDHATARVYGAAVGVAGEKPSAEAVARDVLIAAARADRLSTADERELLADTLRAAARTQPSAAFAAMEPEQREVVVLARLARLTVDEIAATLDIDAPTVKARMLGALRMAAEPAAVG